MPDTQPDTAADETPTVQFEGEFDPDRAKRLIANLREDNAKARTRLAEFEADAQRRAEAEKTELQRATDRAERAEKALADRAATDRRAAIIRAHGLADADAAFLAGVPDEQLDERAQALAARLALTSADVAPELPAKPAPKLTPGHESVSAPVRSAEQIAADILRRL